MNSRAVFGLLATGGVGALSALQLWGDGHEDRLGWLIKKPKEFLLHEVRAFENVKVAGTGKGGVQEPVPLDRAEAWKELEAHSAISKKKKKRQESIENPYDVMVIGGGATGTGCALDAVTRLVASSWSQLLLLLLVIKVVPLLCDDAEVCLLFWWRRRTLQLVLLLVRQSWCMGV